MFQFIFDRALSSNSIEAKLFSNVRELIIRFIDPQVEYSIHGTRLSLGLSHQLPFYRKAYPTYSENLARLASFLRAHYGHLCMIDVGANIGDSYALARGGEADSFLLVDGDPGYFAQLEANTRGDARCVRVNVLLSDVEGKTTGELVASQGTAHVTQRGTRKLHYMSLDQLIELHPSFYNCILLKIDVDGLDELVLAGAGKTLDHARPVIFFEHSARDIVKLGRDPSAVRRLLVDHGYTRLHYYDNLGYFIGVFDHTEENVLARLDAYIQRRSDYYYDICSFHDSQLDLSAAFAASEAQEYDA